MRNVLLSGVMSLALVGTAMAADLPSRRAPVPYALPPVFTWTGFYAGLNVGGGENRSFTVVNNVTAAGVGTTRPGVYRIQETGVVGGGQIGYNYQIGGLVLGVEADIMGTDFDGNRTIAGTGTAVNFLRNRVDYVGTVRGRVGYAWDRLLVYGTGGFAYGDVYNRQNFTTAGATTSFGARSQTQDGWAAGGGVEYAIPTDSYLSFLNFFHSSAVTIRAEYLHYDLGRERHAVVSGAGAVSYSARTHEEGDIGRIGINYKF